MARVSVQTQKPINLAQLASELGTDQLFGPAPEVLPTTDPKDIAADGVTQAALQAAIDAHTFDADWRSDPAERDWRVLLASEITFITNQLATWPADATTSTQAIQRVNFLLTATKRLARNQERILEFIRDKVMDSSA